ncbi:MAG: ATP-binding cassette domain-containing protein [Roseburia sp.]|nr:ATP-binding cassette domain-containing protein [Roseburia sp.]
MFRWKWREVGLYDFRNHYPQQLSGGMKQRAAVARVLALKPKILLMDEPFASLDMVTRHNLQKLIREKCKKYGITVVFVTHGVEEAVLTGDRIVIMKADSLM